MIFILFFHCTKAYKYYKMFADIWKTCKVHKLISLKNNATASYSTLKCAFRVRMSVFVFIGVILPSDNLFTQ